NHRRQKSTADATGAVKGGVGGRGIRIRFCKLAVKPDTTEDMAQESTGRRDFLKAAGGAALTTSLFTGNIKGANDKVNVAFIGVGRMGSGNVGYAAKVPGLEIAAVCDVYQP